MNIQTDIFGEDEITYTEHPPQALLQREEAAIILENILESLIVRRLFVAFRAITQPQPSVTRKYSSKEILIRRSRANSDSQHHGLDSSFHNHSREQSRETSRSFIQRSSTDLRQPRQSRRHLLQGIRAKLQDIHHPHYTNARKEPDDLNLDRRIKRLENLMRNIRRDKEINLPVKVHEKKVMQRLPPKDTQSQHKYQIFIDEIQKLRAEVHELREINESLVRSSRARTMRSHSQQNQVLTPRGSERNGSGLQDVNILKSQLKKSSLSQQNQKKSPYQFMAVQEKAVSKDYSNLITQLKSPKFPIYQECLVKDERKHPILAESGGTETELAMKIFSQLSRKVGSSAAHSQANIDSHRQTPTNVKIIPNPNIYAMENQKPSFQKYQSLNNIRQKGFQLYENGNGNQTLNANGNGKNNNEHQLKRIEKNINQPIFDEKKQMKQEWKSQNSKQKYVQKYSRKNQWRQERKLEEEDSLKAKRQKYSLRKSRQKEDDLGYTNPDLLKQLGLSFDSGNSIGSIKLVLNEDDKNSQFPTKKTIIPQNNDSISSFHYSQPSIQDIPVTKPASIKFFTEMNTPKLFEPPQIANHTQHRRPSPPTSAVPMNAMAQFHYQPGVSRGGGRPVSMGRESTVNRIGEVRR